MSKQSTPAQKPSVKNRALKPYLKRFILYAGAAYILCLGYLYFFQNSLIYLPNNDQPVLTEELQKFGFRPILVPTADGLHLYSWMRPPAADSEQRIFVFFHGNSGNFGSRAVKLLPFLQAGDGVILASYRGYGSNSGVPSEEGLKLDAEAFVEFAHENFAQSPLIAYGESLGTAMAVHVAQKYDFAAVILEAPFDTAYKVARDRYPIFPVKTLMNDKYETENYIGNVTAPLIFLHGKRDSTTSYKRGVTLFEKAPFNPKIFLSFDQAGHNNLWDHAAGEKLEHVLRHLPFKLEMITLVNKEETHRADFTVEWADDSAKTTVGMMHRTHLPAGKGMIFIFEGDPTGNPYNISMWMRNTPSALDMAFIDKSGEIIAVFENTTPFSDEFLSHHGYTKAVLELPAGSLRQHGFSVGDKVLHDFFTDSE